ncbi:MAG: hypothetical protein AAGD14_19945, partial [Planctomycetota bacterium]
MSKPKQRARSLRSLLAVQFLGIFNDNAWKWMVIVLLKQLHERLHGQAPNEAELHGYTEISFIALTAPLVLFSIPAGWLADRISKRTVTIAMKWLELVFMVAGFLLLTRAPDNMTGL